MSRVMGVAAVVDGVRVEPGSGVGRGLVLPEGCTGTMVVGLLTYCQASERSEKQLDLDVQVLDPSGRMSIVRMSGFIVWPDGKVTELGRLLQLGKLANLVGSEVAVIVSQRVSKDRLYTSPETIIPLVRG